MRRDTEAPPAPEQHIEMWRIDRLVEYPRNPRKNDTAVDRMCGSIREFGFKIPVLARSDGEVFIYVNDTLIFLPWLWHVFYDNNQGSAEISLKKM